MSRIFSPRWLLLVLLMAVSAVAASSAQAAPAALNCAQPVTQGARTSYYGCAYQPTAQKGEAAAREFIAAHAADLGMDADTLRLVEVKRGLASTHTRFMQTIDGLDVYGAWVSVHQGRDNAVHTLHQQYYAGLTTGSRTPTVAQADAEAAAAEAAGVTVYRLEPRTQLVWYPVDANTAVLAWETTIFSDAPLGDFLTLVDAANGTVMLQENRVALDEGTGYSYEVNPVQHSGDVNLADGNDQASPLLNAQRIPVTLLGLDSGTGLIKGEFVDLSTLNSTTIPDVDANEANRVYLYDRNNKRFEQVVIYQSLDRVQRYIHSLGFDDDGPLQNGIRDFPSLANAHWYTADNSFYSTGNDAVHFGDGGVDDGEDVEVVAHEYGHAIHHNQNASWGSSFQMRAMGEGWGDYLAVTVYYDDGDFELQRANTACVAEWDATSYSGDNPPCLRRTDGTKIYPGDLTNSSVHADGEIWSRALWDVRRYLGGRTADQIIFEHHFGVPAAASMTDAAIALLQADVDVNGGANANAIRHAFCTRGILSGTTNCTVTADYSMVAAPRNERICAGDPGQYWLTVAEQGDWTSPVTLSASGNPAGTSATFSANPVTTDASPTFIVGNTAAIASGTYTLTLSAASNGGSVTDSVLLTVQTDAAAPTLTAPANNASNVALTPTFTWTGDGQSDSYLIEVSTDSAFSTVVASAVTTLGTFTPNTPLTVDTNYYWRVTPSNLCDTGAVSPTFVFFTGTPTAITLSNFDSGTSIPVVALVAAGLLGLVVVGLVRRRR